MLSPRRAGARKPRWSDTPASCSSSERLLGRARWDSPPISQGLPHPTGGAPVWATSGRPRRQWRAERRPRRPNAGGSTRTHAPHRARGAPTPSLTKEARAYLAGLGVLRGGVRALAHVGQGDARALRPQKSECSPGPTMRLQMRPQPSTASTTHWKQTTLMQRGASHRKRPTQRPLGTAPQGA